MTRRVLQKADQVAISHADSLDVLLAAIDRYRFCKAEQAERGARGEADGMVCRHTHWNGGDERDTCVTRMFAARDALTYD